MCELLGLSFNLEVNPSITFRGFRKRGIDNPDGWGIAFYPDEAAQIIKEPINAANSYFSKVICENENIKSKIFIGHVRKKSEGKIGFRDTHPFSREMKGKEYVFAHNGTIKNFESFNLGRFKPIGGTDSEHIFCYLLNLMWDEKIFDIGNSFKWFLKRFREINKSGKLNLILSDGKYLVCHHDLYGYKGLHFLRRKTPFKKVRLLDEDWVVDFPSKKNPGISGYIIASKPLTDEKWEKFEKGELKIFKDGEIVFSDKI